MFLYYILYVLYYIIYLIYYISRFLYYFLFKKTLVDFLTSVFPNGLIFQSTFPK